ncbi:hypothetical protein IDH44_06830 [Paenibacillus sp. IB182496]|uniref:Uncharacterized protein n=1 Tax=Paenibacillus sabuli TaxID=2772509 RepID=A0A927BRF0_9BACL|nr:hypothetical protein [Paenibacillus sabuli]MBD2844897.1 hypothetical protein [Paenibacillus sabuli]
MASAKVRPPLLATRVRGAVLRTRKKARQANVTGPILPRLTVAWVQQNGVPFDTTGFFARLFRGNTLVQSSGFDRFGVVRFSRVNTLTNASFTVRVYSDNGVLFRTRTIPAGVEIFAVIG